MGQGVPVMRAFPILLAVLIIASCGSDKAEHEGFSVALAEVTRLVSGKAAVPAPPALNRAAIDQGGNPLIRARIEKVGLVAFMGKIGEGRGAIIWSSVDGTTLAIRDGVVISTRGMGTDLMSSASPTAAQLATADRLNRQNYYLFGGETEQLVSFDCQLRDQGPERITVVELAYDTSHRVETCTGSGGLSFENHYWFDNRAIIRQSRQWISPDVGFLELQDLNR